jgi:endonuclease/exonuclease/phosphatase family metal-dependent hydrolase
MKLRPYPAAKGRFLMNKSITVLFRTILITAASAVGLFLLFLAFIILTDYRPDSVEPALTIHNGGRELTAGETISITTFNTGYAGLDAGQDFFMDGGIESRSSSLEQTMKNLEGIISFIHSANSDIYALQEVDTRSSRSFRTDQVSMITEAVGGNYGAWFAFNYKAKWVPVPVSRPMGYANSGLLTLSRFKAERSERISLPGTEPFPKRYFDLKRMIMVSDFPVDNGRTLSFVHLHLSAFDKGGAIRAQQVAFLEEYVSRLYDLGNYVIIAGDWNHLLDRELAEHHAKPLPEWVAMLPEGFLATDFAIACDPSIYTVRDNAKPYVRGENFETVIDGFFVSRNIHIEEVRGTDLGFEHSDHNPVTIKVVLE